VVRRQSEIVKRLDEPGRSALRPVRPAELHLTLVFLGEVDEAAVPALSDLVAQGFAMPPFDIEFGASGVFPPRGRARVLWLDVSRGAAELARLYSLVSERLASADAPPAAGAWRPHLTIGRWREGRGPNAGQPLPRVAGVIVERVSEVSLVHSRLLPGGPQHTTLVRGRLELANAGR
jgi:2'-5' RNA ligase